MERMDEYPMTRRVLVRMKVEGGYGICKEIRLDGWREDGLEQ